MSLTGVVQNGVVILEPECSLPDGTRVEVVVKEASSEPPKPTLTNLLKHAGVLADLPSDFAQQHDHYLHGTPKR